MGPVDSRARAESRPRLEPPRNRQETAKRLESSVESARGPLSEPARAAKRLESARGPLFEPPTARLPRDSSRLVAPTGSKGSSPLGSCTTLVWHQWEEILAGDRLVTHGCMTGFFQLIIYLFLQN